MDGVLGPITDRMADHEARLQALEALSAEPLAKARAEKAEAEAKAALDRRVAAKQAEIDALNAEPEPPAEPKPVFDAWTAAKAAKLDKLDAELEAIKSEPERAKQIAEKQAEIDALQHPPAKAA